MAEVVKVGARVDIIGKNLKGTVAYVGTTMFAPGKWIGVVLDAPKGKNDGSVQGKRYFDCGDNFGVFVRQQHISVITDDTLKPSSSDSRIARTPSPSQLPVQLSRPSGLPTPSGDGSKISKSSPKILKKNVPASVEPSSGDTTEIVKEAAPHIDSLASTGVSSLMSGVSMAEVESLKAQVKDWKDKFETIRLKRQADRDKLKDLEKAKLQVQQLSEFKSRMSEQNQDLLKQLRDSKKEAKEAVETKEKYMDEMSDVHETIEMATLDKEMAEEKVESLQQELETWKERAEELQTDLEIVKAEIEDKGSSGAASSYQLKQLEEQNSRLKEALIRMRDLSTAEKSEHQALEKQVKKKDKEFDDVVAKNEKLTEELENAESTIDELKEQVDAALVAEEMVEELTDKNLQLEEKITDYEDQVHDLETMNEMNEELQENARENEMELREEVDIARSKMKEAERKAEAAGETISDFEDTIRKFRKLVQELQEANHELTQQQLGDDKSQETLHDAQIPFNYQIKMVETKAAARSVDLDLRKLDAQQANDHAQYLTLFMPNLFSKRGGDSDCVQVLLLVGRISKKAEIIGRHVSDRFEIASPAEKLNDVLGIRGEQQSFASELVCMLLEVEILMDRYELALAHCSVELFQTIGTLYLELVAHEHVFDFFAEQLRRDSLDETTSTIQLSKAIEFFKHLYRVHVMKEPHIDCWKMLDEHVKQSNALLNSIQINVRRIKAYLKTGHETSSLVIFLRDMETASSDIKQFCKKLKRRMPQGPDNTSGKISLVDFPMLLFGKDVIMRMQTSEDNLSNVFRVFVSMMKQISVKCGVDDRLSHQEMEETFVKASNSVFTNSGNGYDVIRVAVGDIMATMNSLVTSLQEGEFDTTNKRSKVTPPVEKRAQTVKAEITDSEGLSSKLSDKDTVIHELRKSLKLKAAEFGELKVKIGMLERKLEKSGRVEEEQHSRLQQENDSLKEELKKKEREYDETLDTLQHDIDTLEDEKSELKQRLIAQSKRSLTNVKASPAQPSSKSNIASILAGAAAAQGSAHGAQVIVEDSPLMSEQIQALQIALKAKRIENYKWQGSSLRKRMKKLAHLNMLKLDLEEVDSPRKLEIRKLQISLQKLKEHILSIACPKVVDINKNKAGMSQLGSHSPSQQILQEQMRLQLTRDKVLELQTKATQLLALQKINHGNFGSFISQPISKTAPVIIGKLSLPAMSSEDKAGRVVLEPEELMQLHDRVVSGYAIS